MFNVTIFKNPGIVKEKSKEKVYHVERGELP